jgi:hypothetical protein
MYGKIFDSIYDGSLYGQWEAIVTLQQMIVLCDAEGFVDMTPQALAARTSIPLEIIAKGIELLLEPDRYSRTEGADGKRIEPIDPRRPWGWRIVNYGKYREMRTQEDRREYRREYMKDYRAPKDSLSIPTDESVNSSKQSVNTGKQSLALLADADADADAKKIYVAKPRVELHQKIIDAYHETCPTLPAIKTWPERRAKKLARCISERVGEGKPAGTVEYWQALFRKVAASDFLCGRKTDWRADLEWLLEPKHFAKLIEGGFDNVERGRA